LAAFYSLLLGTILLFTCSGLNKMICSECQDEFDPNDPSRIKLGGKRIHCGDCCQETTTKYLGLQAGDGKQTQVQILAFDSPNDREKYKNFWQNNSGLHKNKACQLGNHLSTTPGIKFRQVNTVIATNHKGKLT